MVLIYRHLIKTNAFILLWCIVCRIKMIYLPFSSYFYTHNSRLLPLSLSGTQYRRSHNAINSKTFVSRKTFRYYCHRQVEENNRTKRKRKKSTNFEFGLTKRTQNTHDIGNAIYIIACHNDLFFFISLLRVLDWIQTFSYNSNICDQYM